MDGKKVYQISINGVQESINAVTSLNKQLDTLDSKIKELQKKDIKIESSSSGVDNSGLKEKIALQKELNQLKKEEAAQQRLTANEYENTMKGMKQQLADLKTVINATDLGDSDSISKMTKDANGLTNKLKEMEQAYGQFGRNVGNYANGVAEGLSKIKVNVGGTVREFDNARQASKTLNNELKAMALNGQQDTKAFKDLQQAVMQMESTMNDAKQPMDNLMDTMQSFVAITQVSKGFSAFFGFDNTAIEKSIQRLVALQNAMQGLQTLAKQMQTREGLGMIFNGFSTQVDKATAKLLTFNTALLGTGKASRIAAVGVKAFGKALKAAVSVGILLVIDLAIEGLEKLWEWFNKDKEAAKKLAEENHKLAESYGNAASKLKFYELKVRQFNGTRQQEKKLVEDLNREFGKELGTYKTLAKWKEVLTTKGYAYCRMMVMEAKMQQLVTKAAAAYLKMEEQMEYKGGKVFIKNIQGYKEARAEVEKLDKQMEKLMGDTLDYQQKHGLGDFAPQVEKNTKKTEDALKKEQEELEKLQLSSMKESLAKTLKQLEINKEKEIAALKKNKKAINNVEKRYAIERQKIIDDYFKKIDEQVKENANRIKTTNIEIDVDKLNAQIDALENKFDELNESRIKITTVQTSSETKEMFKKTTEDKVKNTSSFMYYQQDFNGDKKYVQEYYEFLNAYVAQQQPKVREFIKGQLSLMAKDSEEYYNYIATLFMANHQNEIRLLNQFGGDEKEVLDKLQNDEETTLSQSLERRLELIETYSQETRTQLIANIEDRSQLLQKANEDEMNKALIAENNAFKTLQEPLKKTKENLEQSIADFKVVTDKDKETLDKLKTDLKNINDQIETNEEQHEEKLATFVQDGANKQDKIIMDSAKQKSQVYEGYWNDVLDTLSETSQKVSTIISNGGIIDNIFGIVNPVKTHKELKEAEDAAKKSLNKVQGYKASLDMMMMQGLITPEVRNKILQQLNQEEIDIKTFLKNIQEALGNNIPNFVQSLQVYINGIMDSFNTIMSEVWNAEDIAFDKEQEEIDKANEALDKALDKQQEIIEEHKSAIDSIEDELASARGDRRQRLIDQINAEIAAQRAAQKEEAKIQKKKEAQEKKQEELDKKRKKAEYDRSIIQAIVNGAMAVTMAAVNTWPVPAIPMMALAAATTAAQLAIMKSNKPYAKGGLLEGKSHKEGGIPVGNSGIEVEGQEYVVRKKSTAPNLDVLEYINKSERRLSLDDFIDFFTSGKAKKVIMHPSRHFAEGGTLPLLNNNYDFDDRLITAFEKYAQRPSYVSVVDINSRQAAVKNVQVLAGLSE